MNIAAIITVACGIVFMRTELLTVPSAELCGMCEPCHVSLPALSSIGGRATEVDGRATVVVHFVGLLDCENAVLIPFKLFSHLIFDCLHEVLVVAHSLLQVGFVDVHR